MNIIATFLLALASLAPQASDEPSCETHGESGLDGQAFEGTIRAKGPFGLFAVKGVLSFESGAMAWRVGAGEQDLYPACYTTTPLGAGVAFTSNMRGRQGDKVAWSGRYEDGKLEGVEAVWQRQPGDFVHDLLLPDLVTLRFKAHAGN